MSSWLPSLPFGLFSGDQRAAADGNDDNGRRYDIADSRGGASLASAARRRTIRICTLNAYLIPAAFVNKDNATCKDQGQRAERIGRWLRAKGVDVALLQEVWGGGQPALEAAVNADQRPMPPPGAPAGGNVDVRGGGPGDATEMTDATAAASSVPTVPVADMTAAEVYRVLPWCGSWGSAAVDALWQYTTGRGGLWVAHRTGSPLCPLGGDPLGVRWMRYSRSKTKSRKGAVAARFRAYTSDGRPTSLIVVNTHVDPMNDDGIIEFQFKELLAFIQDAVLGVRGLLAPTADGGSEAPPLVGGGLDCAVVLCGDLNADPEGALGKRLLAVARGTDADPPSVVRDLYAEYRGWLPRAPTYDCKRNSLVMWPQQERLDWVLGFDRLFGVPLRCASVRDAKVHDDDTAVTGGGGGDDAETPFSDHFPVTVDLEL